MQRRPRRRPAAEIQGLVSARPIRLACRVARRGLAVSTERINNCAGVFINIAVAYLTHAVAFEGPSGGIVDRGLMSYFTYVSHEYNKSNLLDP